MMNAAEEDELLELIELFGSDGEEEGEADENEQEREEDDDDEEEEEAGEDGAGSGRHRAHSQAEAERYAFMMGGLSAPPPPPVEDVDEKHAAPRGGRAQAMLDSRAGPRGHPRGRRPPPSSGRPPSAAAALPPAVSRFPPEHTHYSSLYDMGVRSKMPMAHPHTRVNTSVLLTSAMRRATGTRRVVPLVLSAAANPEHVVPRPGSGLKCVGLPPPRDTTPWPDKWEHACWWCTYEFDGRPVGCPTRHDELRNIYYVSGFFCSYNCARAWGSVHQAFTSRDFLGMWIMQLVRAQLRAAGEKLVGASYMCEAAPSPMVLKRFGGHMDIDEFRRVHCRQTRLQCVPQSVNLVPLGINIFELPRDESKLFARAEPPPNFLGEGGSVPASVEAAASTAAAPPAARARTQQSAQRGRKRKAPASAARIDAYRSRVEPVVGTGEKQLKRRLQREANEQQRAENGDAAAPGAEGTAAPWKTHRQQPQTWNRRQAELKDAASGEKPRSNNGLVMQRAIPQAHSATSIQAVMGLRFKRPSSASASASSSCSSPSASANANALAPTTATATATAGGTRDEETTTTAAANGSGGSNKQTKKKTKTKTKKESKKKEAPKPTPKPKKRVKQLTLRDL